MITSRLIVLFIVFVAMATVLIYRLFYLQIVNGASYLENFQLKIQKEKIIQGTRGNIYDCNGKLLAYNELAYSVTIEDVYESGSGKNERLNSTLYTLIKMIEKNGDEIINDFQIVVNQDNEYEFTVEGTALKRFLADVYGHTNVDDLRYEEETATAEDIINYLAGTKRYEIGAYDEDAENAKFIPGKGYTKKEVLQLVTIRYAMSAYSYQKYIATTVATDVSQETVAMVMENADSLEGVSISEDTIRKYNYPEQFCHILGYTGKISQAELDELSLQDDSYTMNDTVGKSGIEQVMELALQGKKGSETIYVDNMGKVIDTTNIIESQAGNDLYLSIDSDLQVAIYSILEQKIAGILVSKIANLKNYDPSSASSASNIKIPMDDVYFALINNSVIDISHFSSDNAGTYEMQVNEKFYDKKAKVIETLQNELNQVRTPYDKLTKEYKAYESYVISMLVSKGVLLDSVIDKNDATYLAWTKEETISMYDYLAYAIAMNWIDITKLDVNSQYSDSEEVFSSLVSYISENLDNNTEFSKKLYKYMIAENQVSGKELCMILWEQDIISVPEYDIQRLSQGSINAYDFMLDLIENLQITPAQLALDPCSGSCVITDVNTGEVKAMVSYPGYDINRLANSVDSEYYAKLNSDLSLPLWDYSTQQRSAPGSTFKMVSAVAGLEENVITLGETITCTGSFDKLYPTIHHCWISPGAHGALNVSGAIENSCNDFFYEVGYRLSQDGTGYNSDYGLSRLKKYADLFGLTEKSGVEVVEAEPKFSDELAVPSAIGQGTHNYTTVGLARYVSAVANSGTVYQLSILDKLTDSEGNLLEDYTPAVRNTIDLPDNIWNAIHTGMRRVVEHKSYYNDLSVHVAGKTGTAQQSKTRSNHALFVGYAPYEDPEIAIATRVAFGYSSDYAAEISKDVLAYYYGLVDEEELLTGTAEIPEASGNGQLD